MSGMGAASCLLCVWFIPTPAFNHLIRNNIRTPASLPFFGRLFHQLQLYYSLGHSLLCFCELSSSVVFLVLQVMFSPYAYTPSLCALPTSAHHRLFPASAIGHGFLLRLLPASTITTQPPALSQPQPLVSRLLSACLPSSSPQPCTFL